MKIDEYFDPFIRSLRGTLRNTAKTLLKESKEYSLTKRYDYNESEGLPTNIRKSVMKCTRGKDTVIEVYKEFIGYLKKKGIKIDVSFPPIPVDNTFERLMFIAKYLQDPEAKISSLPDLLWVSDRTIESDLQRLRGESDPIQICGKSFCITDTTRSGGSLCFESTAHPIFLTENLTQVLIMLKGLKKMAEDPMFSPYAVATASEIWRQLSTYAKNRIKYVLNELLPEDYTWYEALTSEDNMFHSEYEVSVKQNVFLDCMKNGKLFYIEYLTESGTEFYTNCLYINHTYSFVDGEICLEVQCDQGRKKIEGRKVLRSAYTLEELSNI